MASVPGGGSGGAAAAPTAAAGSSGGSGPAPPPEDKPEEKEEVRRNPEVLLSYGILTSNRSPMRIWVSVYSTKYFISLLGSVGLASKIGDWASTICMSNITVMNIA